MRFAALGLFLALVGCNSPPGDLRTWRAEDHDHTTNPGQDQVVAGPDAGPSAELAWGQNCTRCHGQVGRGDGPQGPMFKPTDLTNPTWQRSVTDEGIANAIKNGRGQMPPFPSLPDSTVKSLVRLVRLLDSSKLPQQDEGTEAPPPSAAPVNSARPRPAPSAR